MKTQTVRLLDRKALDIITDVVIMLRSILETAAPDKREEIEGMLGRIEAAILEIIENADDPQTKGMFIQAAKRMGFRAGADRLP